MNELNFHFTGLQVDPERLGLTPEARFKIEKVIATDGVIKSSIQKLGPIKYKCDEIYGEDVISFADVRVTIALLIRQFGVADNVVQWTPEKLEELKGEYRAQGAEENAGDEDEVTRISDTQDSDCGHCGCGQRHCGHCDCRSYDTDECADEDIENKVRLVTFAGMIRVGS